MSGENPLTVKRSMDDIVRLYAEEVAGEKEYLCAKFLVEHPELKVSDIELVHQNTIDGFKIWVQKKDETG